MLGITNADREAAKALRGQLADVSGFWHTFNDDSALCRALAQHRADAERRILDKLMPYLQSIPQPARIDLPRSMDACGEASSSGGLDQACSPFADVRDIRLKPLQVQIQSK